MDGKNTLVSLGNVWDMMWKARIPWRSLVVYRHDADGKVIQIKVTCSIPGNGDLKQTVIIYKLRSNISGMPVELFKISLHFMLHIQVV